MNLNGVAGQLSLVSRKSSKSVETGSRNGTLEVTPPPAGDGVTLSSEAKESLASDSGSTKVNLANLFGTQDQGRKESSEDVKQASQGKMKRSEKDFTPEERVEGMNLSTSEKSKATELLTEREEIASGDLYNLVKSLSGNGHGSELQRQSVGTSGTLESAFELLIERPDLDTERVRELATSVAKVGNHGNGGQSKGSFQKSAEFLQDNRLGNPDDLNALSSTLNRGKAQGGSSFSESARMMGENPNIDSSAVDKVLREAENRPGVGENGVTRKGRRPDSIVNDLVQGVNDGSIQRANLSSYFDTPAAELAGFARKSIG